MKNKIILLIALTLLLQSCLPFGFQPINNDPEQWQMPTRPSISEKNIQKVYLKTNGDSIATEASIKYKDGFDTFIAYEIDSNREIILYIQSLENKAKLHGGVQ